jgi:hypothetical protein
MLTILEEIVLLTIDPRSGRLRGGGEFSVRYALAGAVLFDLALARRIDTDVDAITVVDPTPTGHPIQDGLLAELAAKGGPRSVRGCVEQIFLQRPDLEGAALAELKDKGIIRHETSKLLWVIDRHRFPLVDGAPRQHVTARLAQVVLNDDIPDPRDIMLVSLVHAAGSSTSSSPRRRSRRAPSGSRRCRTSRPSPEPSAAPSPT